LGFPSAIRKHSVKIQYTLSLRKLFSENPKFYRTALVKYGFVLFTFILALFYDIDIWATSSPKTETDRFLIFFTSSVEFK